MSQKKVRIIKNKDLIEIQLPEVISSAQLDEIIRIVSKYSDNCFYRITTSNEKSNILDFIDVMDYFAHNTKRIFEDEKLEIDLNLLDDIKGLNIIECPNNNNLRVYAWENNQKANEDYNTIPNKSLEKGIYINIIEAVNTLIPDYFDKEKITFTGNNKEIDYYTYMNYLFNECIKSDPFIFGNNFKDKNIVDYKDLEELSKIKMFETYKGLELRQGVYARKDIIKNLFTNIIITEKTNNKTRTK